MFSFQKVLPPFTSSQSSLKLAGSTVVTRLSQLALVSWSYSSVKVMMNKQVADIKQLTNTLITPLCYYLAKLRSGHYYVAKYGKSVSIIS